MPVILAIDLGGTSLRAGLIDEAGTLVACAARPHRIDAEADAEQWWLDLCDLIAELAPRDVVAIAPGGFTRSQVLVDAEGAPVRPAQCFPDGRAGGEAEELAGIGQGTWLDITAYHPLARLLWAKRHDAAAFARASAVLQPKDFLALRLTGRAASDRIASAWALRRDGGVAVEAFRAAGLDARLLPALLAPGDVVGACTHPALRGVPVICGSMDTWCASIGAGAAEAGDAYLISGTTDAAGVLTAAPHPRPGLVTLPWGNRLFHTGGPSGAGADCAVWAAALLGLPDAAALVALAEIANPEAPPLLFLPALSGERAPHWRPDARGAFLGLDRGHGPADLARAVLEGVALADRALLEGFDVRRLAIAGGGARADAWCQIRADLLGCPLHRAAAPEPGLLGAAALAWTSFARFASLPAARSALVRTDAVFHPRPADADRRYALFKSAQAAYIPLAMRSDPG